MHQLSNSLQKNKPLDLNLPNDFSLSHEHYQVLTLIFSGFTIVILCLLAIKAILYCKKRFQKRKNNKNLKKADKTRDNRHEIIF